MSRHSIIKGTFILTLAGLLTRIIGFFYKIFLSNALGAENLGIYQLIFPVSAICHTIYASGIQTSLSKLIAEESSIGNHKGIHRCTKYAVILSLTSALILSAAVSIFTDYISIRFLQEPKCAGALRLLALTFPFAGITSCINGYYYGKKRTFVPAFNQFFEQLVRVFFVYIAAIVSSKGSLTITCELAVSGIVVGEMASCIYNIISYHLSKRKEISSPSSTNKYLRMLVTLALPLTLNKLLLSLLHSFETILIPIMLRKHGMTSSEALSFYGTVNGMSMPFLLFPSALTNALALLLLPTISEAYSSGADKKVRNTVSISVKFTLILGILCFGLFFSFGNTLSTCVFNEESAGRYLTALSFLCPFLYLTTTLGSILNGLGKTMITFISSITGTILKIILIATLVPHLGITGYFISFLSGQLFITFFDLTAVFRYTNFRFDSLQCIAKPVVAAAMLYTCLARLLNLLISETGVNDLFLTLTFCALFCILYILLLLVMKSIKLKELKSVFALK